MEGRCVYVSITRILRWEHSADIRKDSGKKNQKLIITILDEFMEETPKVERHSVRGALSEYANPERMKEESSAWEKAVVKKYGDA